jgi:hypothetical protein
VRANLPTAIAFQPRTDVESRVILRCKGAEALNRRLNAFAGVSQSDVVTGRKVGELFVAANALRQRWRRERAARRLDHGLGGRSRRGKQSPCYVRRLHPHRMDRHQRGGGADGAYTMLLVNQGRRITMSEIIFLVEPDPEGGYTAQALGHSIFTEADTWDELKIAVQDAVRCHFEEDERPAMVRLHVVQDEVVPV